MEHLVSKSNFKAKALEYFREVETTGKELIIADHGKPVLKVVPYNHDPAEALRLRHPLYGSVGAGRAGGLGGVALIILTFRVRFTRIRRTGSSLHPSREPLAPGARGSTHGRLAPPAPRGARLDPRGEVSAPRGQELAAASVRPAGQVRYQA